MTRLLADFLIAARHVRDSAGGVDETSYYTALNNLLDEAGALLQPRVRAVMQLRNLGAGNPDGGLFTADQFERNAAAPTDLAAPARGVIEAKPPARAVDDTAASAQIDRYWQRYKLVLVTNLRDWLLIGEREGRRVTLERFTLAATEAEFWALAEHPQAAQTRLGTAFADVLARVLTHAAPLAEPRDLAALLASYAREALHRVDVAGPAAQIQLEALKTSLQDALGAHFTGDQGEHFFRSTLVQTLFYGLFAAWVLRHEQGQGAAARFDWRAAAYDLHVPMMTELFAQLAQPNRLRALQLEPVLDWAADALNRVDAATFFSRFESARSVQYFYEPFLEAFDPALRRELGVWYTPEAIVRYQVARVHHALQTELGLPDGLADPAVVVLDPCCGTGAYLVEVLRQVAEHARAQGRGEALLAHHLKQAACERLFGFELLPAPYVIAHLQIALLLRQLGAPLAGAERAGVFLTNALTGWAPPAAPQTHVQHLFPEFDAEREAAEQVKRQRRILVILGNPPYNGYPGVAAEEERELSDAYRRSHHAPQPQGQGLNDLYVRFFRMAERQIAEHSGCGVVCFISNASWLDGLSHSAMRERFLDVFDRIDIDDLHGDKYRTGKLTPAGEPDPSAFSSTHNREGIQVGTAIATLIRRDQPEHPGAQVSLRHWWGRDKLQRLQTASEQAGVPLPYVTQALQVEVGYAIGLQSVHAAYLAWPRLPELFPQSYPGIKTSRDAELVDIDRAALEARLRRYFDSTLSDAAIARELPALMQDSNRFAAAATRAALLPLGYASGRLLRYAYRPFDHRWVYWHAQTKLLDEKRSDLVEQVFEGNLWLFTTGRTRKGIPEPAYLTHLATDLNLQDSGARGIPMLLRDASTLLGETAPRPNLSTAARAHLQSLGLQADAPASAAVLFHHALATLHSPAYRAANAGALRQDWPRLPLPANRALLERSAALGQRVAALLDPDTPVPGVTTGSIDAALLPVAVLRTRHGGALRAEEFALAAEWGRPQGAIVMPGRGIVDTRCATAEEAACGLLEAPVAAVDAAASVAPAVLDIGLNSGAFWAGLPPAVWDYTLGGYPVLKKWLSYRSAAVLGRGLRLDEIEQFTQTARRIAALLLLAAELDATHAACAQG